MRAKRMLYLFIMSLAVMACNKNNSDDKVKVSFYLTDAPASMSIDSVIIELEELAYNVSGDKWTKIDVDAEMINLSSLTNGLDTLLGDIHLDKGDKITQVRLVLGNENYAVLSDGTRVALKVPSGQQSGIKVNVQSSAPVTSSYRVVIDFDANKSVHQQGNGNYIMNPVIRAYIDENSSEIYGTIVPTDKIMRVYTVNGSQDTISTLSNPELNNKFVLHGLYTGKYNVYVEDPGSATILWQKDAIDITGGTNINLGEITLGN
ncbi:MAG: DUF4382 domain-containing protein [Marinifilaceae bacterium]